MHLYPLLFAPVVKKMIWGQESWDITCRPLEMSVIENGAYKGMAFDTYLNLNRHKTLGTRHANLPRFPLLIKIITANESLSVQVHPDDEYAKKQNSVDSGKNEMWYILVPPADGKLIIGLRDGVTRQQLSNAIQNKTVTECLHYLPVKTGDIVNIPAGLVHALTPGATIAEIQQNSDTTYRLYDYDRPGPDGKPRELHIGHALAVSDFDGRIPKAVVGSVSNPYFAVNKCLLEGKLTFSSDPRAFTVIINVSDDYTLRIKHNDTTTDVSPRRAVFIPAGMGEYLLQSKNSVTFLTCFVP
jgi:mannose-6-phosphate isomerase